MSQQQLLRFKIREILENHNSLNTCQICRIVHGAKGQHDIELCRPSKWNVRHDEDGFSRRGNNALYVNCKIHRPGYGAVYQALWYLESRRFVDTRIEIRNDPIVPTQKDRMRMWALRGKLPTITSFFEVAEIATNAEPEFTNKEEA